MELLHPGKKILAGVGQTLFLPGNHTHKVITIERYLGISSFSVSLPNALSSLSRWELNKTVMVTPPLRNQIITLLTQQLERIANGTAEQNAPGVLITSSNRSNTGDENMLSRSEHGYSPIVASALW